MKTLAALAFAFTLSAQPAPTAKLEQELQRLAALSPGTLGVTVIHLETGRQASTNAATRFPMASTYKIPIAYELLRRVDAGQERLDRMVTLNPADFHPGSGTLTALFNPPGFNQPGVALSLRHLLELMILISDNSATDILLREVGGHEAVNRQLTALGITGLQLDGPTMEMIRNWRENGDGAQNRLRNTASPAGMAALLARLHRGDLLQPDSQALFLDVLRRCQTGNARLKGMLPEGTAVLHKTGSLGGVANDAGYIHLPGNAGTLAIAVFVKGADAATSEKRDRAIAEIARAAHDYFLFQ